MLNGHAINFLLLATFQKVYIYIYIVYPHRSSNPIINKSIQKRVEKKERVREERHRGFALKFESSPENVCRLSEWRVPARHSYFSEE